MSVEDGRVGWGLERPQRPSKNNSKNNRNNKHRGTKLYYLLAEKKNEAKQITEVDEDEDYDAFGEIRDF